MISFKWDISWKEESGRTPKIKFWKQLLWSMDSINGLVFLLFFPESQLNNANNVGINGWIHLLKKQNGPDKKMRNYFNLQEYSQVSGELLLLLSEELLLNVIKDMKNYLISHKEKIQMIQTIWENLNQDKLILILKLNRLDQILLIWMKIKNRC